jgi:hypothetical protein
MAFRIVPRSRSARLAVAAIALGVASTHSHPLRAQFSKYGSPYGSYGTPYKQYKQYDPYADYGKPNASEDRGDMVPFKRSGGPLLAVVGLDTQRLSIYDSAGRMILQSPVSTGATGYETPAGIFSVVQKKADHNSNLYEDGNMPFMQRITWTGIAMHAGVLPGHPASHGCVRLPMDVARRLFDLTDVGMRVVIVRNDISLAELEHPQLPKSIAARVELPARPTNASSTAASDLLQNLRSIAASKASEAETLRRKSSEVRRVATRKSADAASAAKALQAAEANHARADVRFKDAEKALEAVNSSVTPPTPEAIKRAETTREKAAAQLAETESRLQSARTQAQAKTAAAAAAEDEAKAAEDASDAAQDAAAEAKRKSLPISVFVSRKTQRFYVRQGYVPVFEGPITIQDPEKPLGTYVFTAFGNANERVRWGVVSMYGGGNSQVAAEPAPARSGSRKGGARRDGEAVLADVEGAKVALDRIAIPKEVIQRISDTVLPGSSLIVSDEGPSIETGKDTDFVIVMSGEPQGALKVRQREPSRDTYGGAYGRSPFGGGGFWQW